MKILINTPDIEKPGGVANHYKGLKKFWTHNVTYNYVGGRKGIPGPIILVKDYAKFITLCIANRYDVVLLNPSLGKTALKRDALFLRIAKLLDQKVVVFFHGWDQALAEKITQKPHTFFTSYNHADAFIVLAQTFKKQLKEWGITKPVHLETTKVDDELLDAFVVKHKIKNKNVLFLARVEEDKGIFIALKAFQYLLKIHPDAVLKVAGNGSSLDSAKKFVTRESIQNVCFLGNISGTELIKTLSESTIYILPTTHGEGMPTSVLEAMAFGLPIISRPIGGLTDFFEEPKMGFLLNSLDPKDYAEKLEELLSDQEKLMKIGEYNHNYATHRFMASRVALELENKFENA